MKGSDAPVADVVPLQLPVSPARRSAIVRRNMLPAASL